MVITSRVNKNINNKRKTKSQNNEAHSYQIRNNNFKRKL